MLASNSESGPLRVVHGWHTDVGRRRENNEDSARCVVLSEGTLPASTLLLVSDGVGGSNAGEVASRAAVEGVIELLTARLAQEEPPPDRRRWIDAIVRETDGRIRELATRSDLSGTAATLSLLWIGGRQAWWAQVGDSRIYRLRRGDLTQISRDQSPVGRLRADGGLTEEQARAHPYRHLIDQCLGGAGPAVEPETGAFPVQPGDVFLLCSDGLSDGLWDRDIAEGLKRVGEKSPDEVARCLVDQANQMSGRDNITAVVAAVEGEAPGRPARRWFGLLG